MEILNRKRAQLRREFTFGEKDLLNNINTEDEISIRTSYTTLKDTAVALFKVEDEISEAFCCAADFDEKAYEEDRNKAMEYKKKWDAVNTKYTSIQFQAEPLHSRHCSQTSLTSHCTVRSNNQAQRNNIRLPKLELTKFDGDIRNWLQFWGQFRKIHEDPEIDSVDKFQYLIQSTTENSPARNLVMSYPPSASNYTKAIEAMKGRFARDDMLIQTYVRGLLSLVWSQLKGDNCSLQCLYDNLQTHLQALETLQVTKDKFASILYPMIESALPEELLRSWNRRTRASHESPRQEVDDELTNLMAFLRAEVESEERINMAREGFPQVIPSTSSQPTACFVTETKKGNAKSLNQATPVNQTTPPKCLWCDKDTHSSTECYKASNMSVKDRIEFAKSKKACLICLKTSHVTKKCRCNLKCLLCRKRHVTLMCQSIPERPESENPSQPEERRSNELLCELNSTTLLQTLAAKLILDNKEICVRILIDSGAQRSYIKKDLTKKLGLKPVRTEELSHCLFGGVETNTVKHSVFDITLKSLCNNFSMCISVLEQENICGILPKVRSSVLIEQLQRKGITLTDTTATPDDITLLIGADFSGILMTGNFLQLENNLTAVQTKLGWTVQGPVSGVYTTTAMTATLQSSIKPNISDLWDLQVLGIRDPTEQVSKKSRNDEVLQHFNETIIVNEENRYEVCLPWRENAFRPEPNYEIAKRRLSSTMKRIKGNGVWSVFVTNKVREIRASSSKDVWKHIPGHLNSADSPLRVVGVKTLLKSEWWSGPAWLSGDKEKWLATDFAAESKEVDEERRKTAIRVLLVEETSNIHKIKWHFLPPSAPWWGGFHERPPRAPHGARSW